VDFIRISDGAIMGRALWNWYNDEATIFMFSVEPQGEGLGAIFYRKLEERIAAENYFTRIVVEPRRRQEDGRPYEKVVSFWRRMGFTGSTLLTKDIKAIPSNQNVNVYKEDGGDVKKHPLDDRLKIMKALSRKTDSRIIFLIIDGLGGLEMPGLPGTELEKAIHPNLDALTPKSSIGLVDVAMAGITPGSGPGHFAAFGYDPLRHSVGRGILDAMGDGILLEPGDIVARVNFATAKDGIIVDRRAGRVPTEVSKPIAQKCLTGIKFADTQAIIQVTKEHRGVLILRGGAGLSAKLTDTDPGVEGVPARQLEAKAPQAQATAELVRKILNEANSRLSSEEKVNYMLLRSWDELVQLPSFNEVYKLTPAAVATYPAYKGIASVAGMKLLPVAGRQAITDEFDAVRKHWDEHDFFYVHFKYTDKAGEDGDFDTKVHYIEEIDSAIGQLTDLLDMPRGDTLVVTGDHSTPAAMKGHSWHKVPVLIYSKDSRGSIRTLRFTEDNALFGSLGPITGRDIMPLAMAHSGKLEKLDGPIDFSVFDGGENDISKWLLAFDYDGTLTDLNPASIYFKRSRLRCRP